MSIEQAKGKGLACELERLNSQEQERHSCTLRPTEQAGCCEHPHTIRCDQRSRELYRNHFPTDR
jgi:hypothetical protein